MNGSEARELVERVVGYWPSPPMTDEEARTWRETLTKQLAHVQLLDDKGHRLDTGIQPAEARRWVSRNLNREWRPGPNLLETWVRAERRASSNPDPLPEPAPVEVGDRYLDAMKTAVKERRDFRQVLEEAK